MTECACFLMTETLLTPREMEDDVTRIYKWSPPTAGGILGGPVQRDAIQGRVGYSLCSKREGVSGPLLVGDRQTEVSKDRIRTVGARLMR